MDTTKTCSIGVISLQSQVRQFLGRFAQTGYDALSGVFSSVQLESVVRQYCPDHRNRIYPPLTTVSLFLEQVLGAAHSCQDAVSRGLSSRVAQSCSASSLDTGAYCKARRCLSSQLLPALSKALSQRLSQAQSNLWRWRGREIKLIVGTTVFMPDTDKNQATYPQSSQQQPGLGFPIMRIVAIISLGCGAVLDWVCGAS